MTYNRKIMRLELSVENPFHGGHYYTELLLPAADYELKDAMQRVRAAGRENTVEFNIFKCDILPKLQNICLDTFSLDELNFFAKRLISLTDEELPVFYAATKQMFDDAKLIRQRRAFAVKLRQAGKQRSLNGTAHSIPQHSRIQTISCKDSAFRRITVTPAALQAILLQ